MKTIQRPEPELSHALGGTDVWLKREDEHPYGSHKGRSIPLMIKEYRKRDNVLNFVISSSGNAAIAAALTVQKHNQNNPGDNITLKIFVGPHVDEHKLHRLRLFEDGQSIIVEQVENPKQQAFLVDQQGAAKNLRQSTDEIALRGYFDLAIELSKIPNLQAIFIPTSSGTTAQALGETFDKLAVHPQIHIVQTETCHPIAAEFDTTLEHIAPGSVSLAPAIVDQVGHRKAQVIEVIKKTKGSGWIVPDAQIQDAMTLVKTTTGVEISPNSALSVAGLQKALAAEWKFTGAVVCIITGP